MLAVISPQLDYIIPNPNAFVKSYRDGGRGGSGVVELFLQFYRFSTKFSIPPKYGNHIGRKHYERNVSSPEGWDGDGYVKRVYIGGRVEMIWDDRRGRDNLGLCRWGICAKGEGMLGNM